MYATRCRIKSLTVVADKSDERPVQIDAREQSRETAVHLGNPPVVLGEQLFAELRLRHSFGRGLPNPGTVTELAEHGMEGTAEEPFHVGAPGSILVVEVNDVRVNHREPRA